MVNARLDSAKAVALTSSFKNGRGKSVRVGATIYTRRELVAVGVNKNKTHPLQGRYNKELSYYTSPYLHAEMSALLAGMKTKEKGTELYVARKLNREGWGNARPCKACMKAIRDSGIQRVTYTTENGWATEFIEEEVGHGR